MNWNDLEILWKSQEPPTPGADPATLAEGLEARRRKFLLGLRVRDYGESGTAVALCIALALDWWHLGPRGWPLGISIGLLLLVAQVFARERLRSRGAQPGPGAPMVAVLDAYLAELRHQRRMLLGIASWYLAPIGLALVVALHTHWSVLRGDGPGFFQSGLWTDLHPRAWILLYLAVILPGCLVLILVANRRAVRDRIEPRIAELERLRQSLESPEGGPGQPET